MLEESLERVRRSVQQAPRSVTIIYRGPEQTIEIPQVYDWLSLRRRFRTVKGHGYALYDVILPRGVEVL